MKPKTMILMAVAIICGLGASYMTSRLLADKEESTAPPPPPEPERVKMLVAKVNLDNGAAIKDPLLMFTEKSFIKDDAPKDGVTEVKILKGKFLKRALRKGDHITVDDLVDERTSILSNLPDGYQAYGIQVDPASIASGWAAVPGSKVNIIWTMKGQDNKTSFAKVLLEDVLVLAADGENKYKEEGKAMLATVVTVALKSNDALKVNLAQKFGPLYLTLRKFGDPTPPPEKEAFTAEDLFKPAKKEKKTSPTGSAADGNEKDDKKDEIPDVIDTKVEPKKDEPKKDVAKNEPMAEPMVEPKDDPKVEPKTKVEPKDPPKVEPKDDPKIEPKEKLEEPEAPPAPKRYFHTVNFRQGDKQWRQVIEVDAKGRPIQDDVQQEAGQLPEQPALNQQPNQSKKLKFKNK